MCTIGINRSFLLPLALFTALTIFAGAAIAQEYVVGEGDVLKITVYDHADLSIIERVGGDGMINFPLIGQVKVGGKTVLDASNEISGMLADGYIVNPQVTIFVQEFRSKRAVIMGQVKKPGLYEIPWHTTLIELLSKAGGLTPLAGKDIVIRRKLPQSGEEKNITINIIELLSAADETNNIPIFDGDNIYISEVGYFYVTGHVKKPGSYVHKNGMTVIKAITMAGGFDSLAAKRKVKIIRKKDGTEMTLVRVGVNEEIMVDDVIVVPESLF